MASKGSWFHVKVEKMSSKFKKPLLKTPPIRMLHQNFGNSHRYCFKFNNHNKDLKNWNGAATRHFQGAHINVGCSSSSHVNRNLKTHKQGLMPLQYKEEKLHAAKGSWFCVELPYGNKYDKTLVLRKISERIHPLHLRPYMWHSNGSAASFYVEDFEVATRLSRINCEILMPNHFKLHIRVTKGYPKVDINNQMKEKMKLTMAKRYNPATKTLDLTKFHSDSNLHDCFCPLFEPAVLDGAFQMIAENIPEVEAINLFDNQIDNLLFLKEMCEKLPNLKVLHVGKNEFKSISALQPFKDLPIVDLVLTQNPLCARYKEKEDYVGEVRKYFPKVTKLDGVPLPPPISFDISSEVHIPRNRPMFLCNEEGESFVRQFLQHYFLYFDTENRQSLVRAYHESALYSLTISYPYWQRDRNSSWLSWYTYDNRNLLRVEGSDRRQKLLKQGQIAVVAFLQEMPLTKHDLQSFTCDLVIFTPQMVTLTVSGMFKELKTDHRVPPTRYFFRTLVIVPTGSGFCIVNETVHITNATEAQAKEFNNSPLVPTVPASIDDSARQQMISAMAEHSRMNLEWSTRCLEDTQWNFYAAVSAFAEAQKKGLVPPEAFINNIKQEKE